MPVRFMTNGPVLLHYDHGQAKWKAERDIGLSWLKHSLTVEPGVTVGQVFDAVDTSPELCHFLAEYTGCDVKTLHSKDRTPTGELTVPSGVKAVDGEMVMLPEVPANVLRIDWLTEVYPEDEGDFHSFVQAYASNLEHLDVGESLGHRAWENFGDVCQLQLRVENQCAIFVEGGQDISGLKRQISLLDCLDEIYSTFGDPKYDTRDAKSIQDLEDIIERWREMGGLSGDDDDWWKRDYDDDEQ